MTMLPKARVKRTEGRQPLNAFVTLITYRWEVTIDGAIVAEFDNHPDSITYAHRRASEAQGDHVERLETQAAEARDAAEKAYFATRPKPAETPVTRVLHDSATRCVQGFKTDALNIFGIRP